MNLMDVGYTLNLG